MTNDPAGYNEQKHIEAELPKLSQRQRCAFAAVCAGRVLPVVKDYLTQDSLCEAAVEMTWQFACDEPFVPTDARKLLDELEKVVEELYDDDEQGATLHAVNAAIFALESTLESKAQPAYIASCEAQDAADCDMDDGEAHIQQEANWHLRALEVTKLTPSPTRDMYAAIEGEPAWLAAFRLRDV